MDNRDAEAFLKPVSKAEVPDYYDVITNPMDLQTMLKKVKQKQYKSKKEFKDDLDLIWSNCFTYNATEVKNHPLRMCAKRLKVKAERLLKNITDWKERADPVIPADIASGGTRLRPNGVALNGHKRFHSPVAVKSPSPGKAIPIAAGSKKARGDIPFEERPAVVRTADGMAAFMQLDRELTGQMPPWHATQEFNRQMTTLADRLSEYAITSTDDSDGSDPRAGEVSLSTIDGEVGSKRKLNGFVDGRPRKRARTHSPEDKDTVELWWDAVQSEELFGNGLPIITHASSEPISNLSPPFSITDPPREATVRRKKKRKTKPSSNTLLYHMNNNIRTLRRVRTTHAKFASLNQANEEAGGSVLPPPDLAPEEVEDVIDERPWRPMGSGIEIGEESADDCLHWTGSKILEHAGFQGASKVALDVLAGVTSEYLLNVGRTIRFLCDKYSKKMTPEEIILHTLFESGTTRIYELERYIKDEILRYGGRLSELEKKLDTAYREATTEEAWDDDVLFQNGEDEEDGQFVMGNFADSFGEDFLGLRELGIAAEFGLSSLTIPKKLLKGKGKQGLAEGPSASKPSEPPPPFPPPPPFLPLNYKAVEHQIGLLQPYYQHRLISLSAPPVLPIPPPAPPLSSVSPEFAPPLMHPQAFSSAAADPDTPPHILPDDPPSPAHTKMGPLGQIMKGAPSAVTTKKKSKAKGAAAPMGLMAGPSEGEAAQDFIVPSPVPPAEPQRRGRPPGTTNKKKSAKAPDALPTSIA
ncbi:predicted protein [Postia placenta Mad-698-R]|uniref:Bromo domain-containing protein n=1 Tax=Postia placenta MAD-698-R-SB12 TaxID=670580 RepID=A0A1X6MZ14_9APHY|nr:hypothetical protein POSPLADRAFT_1046915 [Postia placenta MAD-698-R-SB12]EED85385.1 predicted protein [Postia placenta Mad-698-R]OSX61614.1 hypothetical protein POSPLADRAFT_1046915 [Postia placenta MAD-698-R-SB12]